MKNFAEYIETAYRDFCTKQKFYSGSISSEFLGINLNNNLSIPVSFKRYYRVTKYFIDKNIFIKRLDNRKMIHAINFVDDTLNDDIIRYEIALTRRTNENMNLLFSELKNILPNEINADMKYTTNLLSNISITDKVNYKMAAIFFIGFVEKEIYKGVFDIKTFKIYYILRHCLDPDNIGKNYKIDNIFFLKNIEDSGVIFFTKLVSIVKLLIYDSECDLWLLGIDFSLNNTKYKIYIKPHNINIYKNLAKIFLQMGEILLSQQILGYEEWIVKHPELERYGLALCIDSHSILTINLYH